jgi:hypothetical protein
LLLNSATELSIFFTGNGILMGQSPFWLVINNGFAKIVKSAGKPIPIKTTMFLLYPTASMRENVSIEANFGDDTAKSFKYDIDKCPGMSME